MNGQTEQNGAGNGEWGKRGTEQGATGELGQWGNEEWKVCVIEG